MNNVRYDQIISTYSSQSNTSYNQSFTFDEPLKMDPKAKNWFFPSSYYLLDNKGTHDNYRDIFTGQAKVFSSLKEKLLRISHRCSALPDIDKRSADEILGYDKDDLGLPR